MRGGWVLSCDPLYAQGLQAVTERAAHNLDHCDDWLSAHHDAIDWSYLGSANAYRRAGQRALRAFSADYAERPEGYVAAALPHIPLRDDAVDVAVCANLLFAYADVMDVDFHVAAIAEMVRVARSEVLIHPLSSRDGSRLEDFTASVRRRLVGAGAAGTDVRRTRHVATRRVDDAHQHLRRPTATIRAAPPLA